MDIDNRDLAKLLLSFGGGGTTLINTEYPHYKFWHIRSVGDDVYTYYGRIGKAVRQSKKTISGEYSRNLFIGNKIIEKKNKGYKNPIEKE